MIQIAILELSLVEVLKMDVNWYLLIERRRTACSNLDWIEVNGKLVKLNNNGS